MRSSLEHAVVDWLMFLGRTYVQRFARVSDETWARCQAERQVGVDWTTRIVRWNRTRRGDVTIDYEGLFSEPHEDGSRDQLSIYYFLLEEYDGLVGPPSVQQEDAFASLDELRAIATEHQARWQVYLTWSALLANLEVNGFVDAADLGRLAVHYRFLSGFTHPVAHKQRELYGNQLDGDPAHYDHYSSEMVLLYAIAIAHLELRNFLDGLSSRTDVHIDGPGRLEEDLAFASQAASYFWFLGTNPGAWDFYQARNQIAFKQRREGMAADVAVPDPRDVPFPSDPFRRLVGLHATSSETEMMTGYRYVSPWPRPDAWRRR